MRVETCCEAPDGLVFVTLRCERSIAEPIATMVIEGAIWRLFWCRRAVHVARLGRA